jgi:hypothetical protein
MHLHGLIAHYLPDPVSRTSAGVSAGGSGLLAVADAVAHQPGWLTAVYAAGAILGPVLIALGNRWISGRTEADALRAALIAAQTTAAVAQAAAEAAERRLAELAAAAANPTP